MKAKAERLRTRITESLLTFHLAQNGKGMCVFEVTGMPPFILYCTDGVRLGA